MSANFKNPCAILSHLAKKDSQGQGEFYVKMSMRYYAADVKKVKGQQKLLNRGFQDLYKELDLANAKTNFTKIVKFVLDKKIEVSKDNVDHSDIKHYAGNTYIMLFFV